MNNANLLKHPALLAICVTGILFFSSCSNTRYGVATKTYKNLTNWKFQFNPGTSNDNIEKLKFEIDQYIYAYIIKKYPPETATKSVSTTFIIDFKNRDNGVILAVSSVFIFSKEAVRGGGVPPPPPPVIPNDFGHFIPN
jgi:hypothetical protein